MSDFSNPKPLVTVQRYRFYSRFQHSEETITAFVGELRNLARDCEFGAALEDEISWCVLLLTKLYKENCYLKRT